MSDASHKPTETQPRPNISTEHQQSGDARRPSDTLDKDQPADRPEAPNHTPGGNDQEAVEDRSNVGIVTPDDYPADQRGGATPA